MIYDVEKVVDYTGETPEWKYRLTLSATELAELEQLAAAAVVTAALNPDRMRMDRGVRIREAFGALKRQLGRVRDLDSIENFKVNRPLPVPAIRRNLDCE